MPTNLDWRALGKVTPVKDQGACASGWVFSGIAAIESGYLIKNLPLPCNQTIDLSEQQMVRKE